MNFKCALVGMAGVGKTALLRRYVTGEYVGTNNVGINGINAQNIVLHTSSGVLYLECFDCVGIPDTQVDACIGVMEQNRSETVGWLRSLQQQGFTFTATCVNKCEKKATDYTWKSAFPGSIKVSAKCNYHLDELLLEIARKLTGNPKLELVEAPAIMTPEVLRIV